MVTAGPTNEYIDPVRFISNKSSGKQGYEIAKSLHKRGFDTTLISGPTNLDINQEIKLIKVETADEMFKATQKNLPADIAVFSAAVSDFKPVKKNKNKKIYDLIFHSRILKDKGILEIIDALKKLQKKKIILRTLILGNPDPKNFSSISIEKLNKWSDSNIIIWKPRVTNVLPYLQKSRIAILPSYREGLPRSLLEAASCELPIISTTFLAVENLLR